MPSTLGIVDANAFESMKPTAVLVDVSRGGVIDPEAAVAAMQNGAIAGAAFDLKRVWADPACSAATDRAGLLVDGSDIVISAAANANCVESCSGKSCSHA